MKRIFNKLATFDLSSTDLFVVEQIEQSKNLFLELSINEFAKKCFISISSLSRLCKKLGFKNYSMFKLFVMSKMSKDFSENKEEKKYSGKANNEIGQIYKNTITKNSHLRKKENNEIDKIASDITTYQKIVGFGNGSSFLPVKHLVYNLEFFGINTYSSSDIHKIINVFENFKNILFIIFSKSLVSREIEQLLKISQKLKIKTYLITSNNNYQKIKRSAVIYYQSASYNNNLFGVSSKIASLYISDIILESVAKKLKIKNKKNLLDDWVNKKI